MSDDEGSLTEVSADFLFDDPNVSYYEDDELRDESKIQNTVEVNYKISNGDSLSTHCVCVYELWGGVRWSVLYFDWFIWSPQ